MTIKIKHELEFIKKIKIKNVHEFNYDSLKIEAFDVYKEIYRCKKCNRYFNNKYGEILSESLQGFYKPSYGCELIPDVQKNNQLYEGKIIIQIVEKVEAKKKFNFFGLFGNKNIEQNIEQNVWQVIKYNGNNKLRIRVLECSGRFSTYLDVDQEYDLEPIYWNFNDDMHIWEIPGEIMKRTTSQMLMYIWKEGDIGMELDF